MFQLAIIIGIYSYILFFLGITNLLFKEGVIIVTIVFALISIITFRASLYKTFIASFKELKLIKKDTLVIFLFTLFLLQIVINLIGALGPELAFDSLWYHLTLPKLYLDNNSIYHIPGGLLYYSDMPKLGELLYIGALAISNEILAKIIHLIFGILIATVIHKMMRVYYNPRISLLAVIIFYSNLVIAWESITAYIDLIRAFFEILAVWAFIKWWHHKKHTWLVTTGIMLGLAISSKLLAVGTLTIFSVLLLWKLVMDKESLVQILKKVTVFAFICLFIPLPWFIFAYINTGNPIYPLFSEVFVGLNAKIFDINLLNPINLFTTLWNTFTRANDPISPLYLILFPLAILTYKRIPEAFKILYWYSLLAISVWYVTSQVEGSRLLTPYLATFSIICAATINILQKESKLYDIKMAKFLVMLVIVISITTISYRAIANSKYIPVITGAQTKDAFLSENLNFSFGDFYDADKYFAKSINSDDIVLIYGSHNLYYIDFPFIHASWIKKGDKFNYIAVHDSELPKRFANWKKVYENKSTFIDVYSDGGKMWTY